MVSLATLSPGGLWPAAPTPRTRTSSPFSPHSLQRAWAWAHPRRLARGPAGTGREHPAVWRLGRGPMVVAHLGPAGSWQGQHPGGVSHTGPCPWAGCGNTAPSEPITAASSHVPTGGRAASATQALADPTTGSPGHYPPSGILHKSSFTVPTHATTAQRRRLRANSEGMTEPEQNLVSEDRSQASNAPATWPS